MPNAGHDIVDNPRPLPPRPPPDPCPRRPFAFETRRWGARPNQGHIMVNPVEESSCFAMLVYKNGSLARERVRDEVRAARTVCRWRAACFCVTGTSDGAMTRC